MSQQQQTTTNNNKKRKHASSPFSARRSNTKSSRKSTSSESRENGADLHLRGQPAKVYDPNDNSTSSYALVGEVPNAWVNPKNGSQQRVLLAISNTDWSPETHWTRMALYNKLKTRLQQSDLSLSEFVSSVHSELNYSQHLGFFLDRTTGGDVTLSGLDQFGYQFIKVVVDSRCKKSRKFKPDRGSSGRARLVFLQVLEKPLEQEFDGWLDQ